MENKKEKYRPIPAVSVKIPVDRLIEQISARKEEGSKYLKFDISYENESGPVSIIDTQPGDLQSSDTAITDENPLQAYRFDTDKCQDYLDNYFKYFKNIRNNHIALLELGIFKGGSLLMWDEYFTNGRIAGLDMDPPQNFMNSERINIYKGDQTDLMLLDRIRYENAKEGFDIIIDDASHFGGLSRKTFRQLFDNHLKPGGIYIVEDWGTGYWQNWPDGENYISGQNHLAGMVGFVKELIDELALPDITNSKWGQPPQIFSQIKSLEYFIGQVFIIKK